MLMREDEPLTALQRLTAMLHHALLCPPAGLPRQFSQLLGAHLLLLTGPPPVCAEAKARKNTKEDKKSDSAAQRGTDGGAARTEEDSCHMNDPQTYKHGSLVLMIIWDPDTVSP